MVKYQGRPASGLTDIRTGRGSPDDRDEQNKKKMAHEDDAILAQVKYAARQKYGVPVPRPDPRNPMAGGELAIGKGMSRQEFFQKNAEDAWVNSRSTWKRIYDRAGNDWVKQGFWAKLSTLLQERDYTGARQKIKAEDTFLLDTFKRARSVGYPVHPINEQPEPLPQKFKAKQ